MLCSQFGLGWHYFLQKIRVFSTTPLRNQGWPYLGISGGKNAMSPMTEGVRNTIIASKMCTKRCLVIRRASELKCLKDTGLF